MGSAPNVLAAREVLDRHLSAKHGVCRVQAKARAVGGEGVNVAGWARAVKNQHGNDATIMSLVYEQGIKIQGRETCKAFHKHFADLFGGDGALDHVDAPREFLFGGLPLSARETEYSEGPITVAQVMRYCQNVSRTSRRDWMVYPTNFIQVCLTCSETYWPMSMRTDSRTGEFPNMLDRGW